MRSLNLRRMQSFATFDLPTNYKYIYSCFRKTHEDHRSSYPIWPAAATRQKLIVDYWENVLLHYLLLVGLSTLFVILISSHSVFTSSIQLSVLFMIGTFTYVPLYYIIYRPTFTGDFLPKLETVITAYEGKERAWLEKCKHDQLSNRALVFLFYVLDKTSKLNFLSPTDQCADQLHIIFGVSPKGMKNELDLVFKKDKRAKLEPRHLLEISKSFEETYSLLEHLQFSEGIKQLKELELRFKRP